MAAIFYLQLTQMLESVNTSSTVLVNPENVGVAYGISLPSCVQAEINVFQVYWSPSWISPHLIVQHCHFSHWIAGPRKHR